MYLLLRTCIIRRYSTVRVVFLIIRSINVCVHVRPCRPPRRASRVSLLGRAIPPLTCIARRSENLLVPEEVNPHAIKEFSQQHRSRVFHDFFQEFQAEHGEAHTDLGMKSDGTSSATPTHGRVSAVKVTPLYGVYGK